METPPQSVHRLSLAYDKLLLENAELKEEIKDRKETEESLVKVLWKTSDDAVMSLQDSTQAEVIHHLLNRPR